MERMKMNLNLLDNVFFAIEIVEPSSGDFAFRLLNQPILDAYC